MATPRDQLKNGYDPALGIFRAEGTPETYKWAVDRLVQEFGWEAIRLSIPTDFGRTQVVGVVLDEKRAAQIPLKKVYLGSPVYDEDDDVSYWEEVDVFDLNEHPEFVDQFIDKMKAVRDGDTW